MAFSHPRVAMVALIVVLSVSGTSRAADLWDWRAAEDPKWSVAVFGGEGTDDSFSDIVENLFAVDGNTERLLAIALRRRVGGFGDHLWFELEGMYGHHYGSQRYGEFGIALYARVHDFPWDDYIVTTMAAGVGPSITTRQSELEFDKTGIRQKTLNQLNLELTLALPEYPDYALLGRLQHRSGIFGTINGVDDASNFVSLGLVVSF